jgi:hypothetical protein
VHLVGFHYKKDKIDFKLRLDNVTWVDLLQLRAQWQALDYATTNLWFS